MGLARNIFDLSLAGGAIIGIVALSLPQPWSSDAHFSSMPPAQAQNSRKSVEIAHFLGIAQFVKNPTAYGFALGETAGEVTEASLVGDRMTITVKYAAAGEVKTAELMGKLDSDGTFTSDRSMQPIAGLSADEMTFTFAADGTAAGYNHEGTLTTRIFL